MWALLEKWDCRPIGPNLTNFDFWEQFPVQNQNSNGVYLKKLPSHVIKAPCGEPFWSNAWLPTGQIWADRFFFHFKFKIQNKFGLFKCKKSFRPKLAKSVLAVGPKAIGRNIFIFFVILDLILNFQTYILWNSWDSLTNHCFFGPQPRLNRPSAKNFFFETYFFTQMVTNKISAQTDERW